MSDIANNIADAIEGEDFKREKLVEIIDRALMPMQVEIGRLEGCLRWEQDRASQHYECLFRKYKSVVVAGDDMFGLMINDEWDPDGPVLKAWKDLTGDTRTD